MQIITKHIELSSKGDCDIIDITPDVIEHLQVSGFKSGCVNLFVVGSTAALTTIEYEPGLKKDLKEFFDKIIPKGNYHHDMTWHDGNGHSHLRASLLGPSLNVPFDSGRMFLGTWQQIIFVDFDNRSRNRKIVVQIIGE